MRRPSSRQEASDDWTALALAARRASEPDEPDSEHWHALHARAEQVLDAEEQALGRTGLARPEPVSR